MDGIPRLPSGLGAGENQTSLCVAPALLDVAGPRTSIRPAAGLPLLYMDHPELAGVPRVIKAVFDRTLACVSVAAAEPLTATVARWPSED